MSRFRKTLPAVVLALVAAAAPPSDDAVNACLAKVREYHGSAGPWAVAGYRIGGRALKELGLPRSSFEMLVVHKAPAEVQYSCVADGLMASTGASPGKLNLKLQEVPVAGLSTTVTDRKSGRILTFTLRPELVKAINDVPFENLEAEGRRVAGLPDDQIFAMTETRPDPPKAL